MRSRASIGRIIGVIALIGSILPAASAGGSGESVLPSLLVETEWLEENLEAESILILDTGRSAEEYEAGHLPGAVFFPVNLYYQEVDGLPGMFAGVAQVQEALRVAGVDKDSAVVVYDPGHGLWATRLFWTLELLGHQKVSVLNGGHGRWAAEGLEFSTESPQPTPGDFVARLQRDFVVTGAELLESLEDTIVIDARSPAEYEGTDVRAARGGHIPGAVNINWVLSNTNEAVNSFLPVDELEEFYAAELAGQEGKIVTHCQTGVRGAHTYFVLRLLGYDGVALYDASWAEWGNDDSLPVTTGS